MLQIFGFHGKSWWAARALFYLGLTCAVLTLLADLSPETRSVPFMTPQERFDPRLTTVRSLDGLEALVKQRSAGLPVKDQVYELETLLSYRFYAGYSRYSFHDNWITWLAAKLVNSEYDAIVDPDQIVRYDWAACSQQAIVTQALLRRMGVPYASIGVIGHFYSAAWIDGEWYMVDPYGPSGRDRTRLHKLEEVLTRAGRNQIFLTPAAKARSKTYDWQIPKLFALDSFPAAHILLFHRITAWASRWLWLVLLVSAAIMAAIDRRWSFRVRLEVKPKIQAAGSG